MIKNINLRKKQLFFWNKEKLNKYQISSLIILLILFLFIVIFRFFNNGWDWINPNKYDSLFYENNILTNIAYILVGFAMPIVGACMQIITHNKLAEPTTLGFYPIVFMATLLSQLTLNADLTSYIFAIILSTIVILINFIIVKGNPTNNTFKSILVGFAINALATGINYLIITYSSAIGNPLSWLTGNIGLITKTRLIISSLITTIFLIIIFCLSNYLNIIERNFQIAKMLGIKTNLIYWIVIISVVMITISNILLIGGVILLGIVIPYLVRTIFKPNNVLLLILISGIMGVCLLCYSSWLIEIINSLIGKVLNINLLTSLLSIFVFISLFKKHQINKNAK